MTAPVTSGSVEPVLQVEDLSVRFETDDGVVNAVNGVTFDLRRGETLGIVGESGSGKSVTAMSLVGLLPSARVDGSACFEGVELIGADRRRLRDVRGTGIALIFQEPMTSLNPVMKVGAQISEALRAHDPSIGRSTALREGVDLLARVGVPDPATRAGDYPHQFSGGMRQRAMIAMAIANRPRLLIADEPTTALDVTIQAQMLDLLRSVQEDTGAALIIISHDLGVIAEMADRVLVMYAGMSVETGDVDDIFHRPAHPYTLGLLASLPRLEESTERLDSIVGEPPDPSLAFAGCPFAPRCSLGANNPTCQTEPPPATAVPGNRHRSSCHLTETIVADPRLSYSGSATEECT